MSSSRRFYQTDLTCERISIIIREKLFSDASGWPGRRTHLRKKGRSASVNRLHLFSLFGSKPPSSNHDPFLSPSSRMSSFFLGLLSELSFQAGFALTLLGGILVSRRWVASSTPLFPPSSLSPSSLCPSPSSFDLTLNCFLTLVSSSGPLPLLPPSLLLRPLRPSLHPRSSSSENLRSMAHGRYHGGSEESESS